MDELFYHSYRTVTALLQNVDEITRARIGDQIFAMQEAFNKQYRMACEAENREDRLRKRYEALKKQLKISNDQALSRNDQRLSL